MNNQHAGLSQALADQHMTQRREPAAMRGCCCMTLARRAARTGHGWPAPGGNWPGRRAPPTSPSAALEHQLIDRRQPCPSAHADHGATYGYS
jgi:hypothetical protein